MSQTMIQKINLSIAQAELMGATDEDLAEYLIGMLSEYVSSHPKEKE